MQDVKEIREELSSHRAQGQIRYPPALRVRAGRWAVAARSRGLTQQEVAAELGMPWQTLRRWTAQLKRPHHPLPPNLEPLPVLIEDPEAEAVAVAHTFVLVTPKGHRVEGLDLDQLATLLEALS